MKNDVTKNEQWHQLCLGKVMAKNIDISTYKNSLKS